MKTVKIYCACDRLNYGDLLFPLIIKKILLEKCHDNLEIEIVGSVKSDLSRYGALPTKSYKQLWNFSKKENKDFLIIAGGEVLETDWAATLSFLSSAFYNIYHRVPFRRLLNSFAQKYIGNAKEPLPFVPSSRDLLNNYHLIFNAVGGKQVSTSPYGTIIKKSIENAVFASFRNRSIYDDIKNNFTSVNPRLSPDSALIMSDVFTQIKTQNNANYITFQVGYFKSMNKLELIAKQLENLQQQINMDIVLTPIGFCSGHDDLKALTIIEKFLDNPKIKVRSEKNIFSLMSLIAESKLYIGTSLHGVITAMSFGLPYLGLNPKIKKLDNYLAEWGYEGLNACTEYANIKDSAIKAMKIDKNDLANHVQSQKDLVYKSFDNIASIIDKA